MGKFFENYDIVSKYGDCEIDLADLIEQVEDAYLFDNTEDDDEIFAECYKHKNGHTYRLFWCFPSDIVKGAVTDTNGDYIEEYVEFLPWYDYWYISNVEIMD